MVGRPAKRTRLGNGLCDWAGMRNRGRCTCGAGQLLLSVSNMGIGYQLARLQYQHETKRTGARTPVYASLLLITVRYATALDQKYINTKCNTECPLIH